MRLGWFERDHPGPVPPRRSHSTAAQGACIFLGTLRWARRQPRDPLRGYRKGFDWADRRLPLFCETVPSMIRQLDFWGVPEPGTAGKKKYASGIETEDTKDKEGLITARDSGWRTKWRCCYTGRSVTRCSSLTLRCASWGFCPRQDGSHRPDP